MANPRNPGVPSSAPVTNMDTKEALAKLGIRPNQPAEETLKAAINLYRSTKEAKAFVLPIAFLQYIAEKKADEAKAIMPDVYLFQALSYFKLHNHSTQDFKTALSNAMQSAFTNDHWNFETTKALPEDRVMLARACSSEASVSHSKQPEKFASILYSQGYVAEKRGDLKLAGNLYLAAARAQPTMSQAFLAYADVHDRLYLVENAKGNHDAASKAFEIATEYQSIWRFMTLLTTRFEDLTKDAFLRKASYPFDVDNYFKLMTYYMALYSFNEQKRVDGGRDFFESLERLSNEIRGLYDNLPDFKQAVDNLSAHQRWKLFRGRLPENLTLILPQPAVEPVKREEIPAIQILLDARQYYRRAEKASDYVTPLRILKYLEAKRATEAPALMPDILLFQALALFKQNKIELFEKIIKKAVKCAEVSDSWSYKTTLMEANEKETLSYALIRSSNTTVTVRGKEAAKECVDRGYRNELVGQWVAAGECYLEALKIDPLLLSAFLNYSDIQHKLQMIEEKKNNSSAAIKYQEEAAYYLNAWILMTLLTTSFEAHILRGLTDIRINPSDPSGYLVLCNVYIALSHIAEQKAPGNYDRFYHQALDNLIEKIDKQYKSDDAFKLAISGLSEHTRWKLFAGKMPSSQPVTLDVKQSEEKLDQAIQLYRAEKYSDAVDALTTLRGKIKTELFPDIHLFLTLALSARDRSAVQLLELGAFAEQGIKDAIVYEKWSDNTSLTTDELKKFFAILINQSKMEGDSKLAKTSEELFKEGKKAEYEGRLYVAGQLYCKAVELDPMQVEFHLAMADNYEELALRFQKLNNALVDPQNKNAADLHFMLWVFLIQYNGGFASLIKAANEYRVSHPNDPKPYLDLISYHAGLVRVAIESKAEQKKLHHLRAQSDIHLLVSERYKRNTTFQRNVRKCGGYEIRKLFAFNPPQALVDLIRARKAVEETPAAKVSTPNPVVTAAPVSAPVSNLVVVADNNSKVDAKVELEKEQKLREKEKQRAENKRKRRLAAKAETEAALREVMAKEKERKFEQLQKEKAAKFNRAQKEWKTQNSNTDGSLKVVKEKLDKINAGNSETAKTLEEVKKSSLATAKNIADAKNTLAAIEVVPEAKSYQATLDYEAMRDEQQSLASKLDQIKQGTLSTSFMLGEILITPTAAREIFPFAVVDIDAKSYPCFYEMASVIADLNEKLPHPICFSGNLPRTIHQNSLQKDEKKKEKTSAKTDIDCFTFSTSEEFLKANKKIHDEGKKSLFSDVRENKKSQNKEFTNVSIFTTEDVRTRENVDMRICHSPLQQLGSYANENKKRDFDRNLKMDVYRENGVLKAKLYDLTGNARANIAAKKLVFVFDKPKAENQDRVRQIIFNELKQNPLLILRLFYYAHDGWTYDPKYFDIITQLINAQKVQLFSNVSDRELQNTLQKLAKNEHFFENLDLFIRCGLFHALPYAALQHFLKEPFSDDVMRDPNRIYKIIIKLIDANIEITGDIFLAIRQALTNESRDNMMSYARAHYESLIKSGSCAPMQANIRLNHYLGIYNSVSETAATSHVAAARA